MIAKAHPKANQLLRLGNIGYGFDRPHADVHLSQVLDGDRRLYWAWIHAFLRHVYAAFRATNTISGLVSVNSAP